MLKSIKFISGFTQQQNFEGFYVQSIRSFFEKLLKPQILFSFPIIKFRDRYTLHTLNQIQVSQIIVKISFVNREKFIFALKKQDGIKISIKFEIQFIYFIHRKKLIQIKYLIQSQQKDQTENIKIQNIKLFLFLFDKIILFCQNESLFHQKEE
ncbi:hypothetical protein ABPG74_010128 [Tetrahymena malaccensis]